ncbi:hypothetical protein N7457_008705 [Penicillium paradoxum]|uniref:uncharacterized protein n=1 Tax=Penicillium paradoxum TaxID=176176 RepID=UPI0025481FC8|nr:uncharacterized protein N7457_008705 [Penicillium paradoxum]KAJ5773809.1 hypothetical protein N7457_008705 [Penicillium paradoxum]
MAYTEERLLQAKRLFDRSRNQFSMRPHLAGPYHLRERASKRAVVLGSWYDNDEDEDYEPPGKRTLSKRKASIFHEADQDPRPTKRSRSLSPARPSGSRLDSDTEGYAPEIPSSPSQHSEPDSWDRYWAVNPETINQNSGYSLRRRNNDTVPGLPQGNDATSVEPLATALPGDALPADKGFSLRECSACQDLGLECSLLSDPDQFAYPCAACGQDELSCVVSPAPKWKQTCESCKDQRIGICSYRYADYDHTLPCQVCINHGFDCVAGPARTAPFKLGESSPTKVDSPPTSGLSHSTPEATVAQDQKSSHRSSPLDINSLLNPASPYDVFRSPSIEDQKKPHTSSPLDINFLLNPASPYEAFRSPSIEDQKQSHASSPQKSGTPAACTSTHGPAAFSTAEKSDPNKPSNFPKISTPSHAITEFLNGQGAQPLNTTPTNALQDPGTQNGIKDPSVVKQPPPIDVIIIDSDDDVPNGQNTPIYISDSPPADSTSLPTTENPQTEKIYRLWTLLAHPVEFLANVPLDGSRPCHWCHNFAYGIVGLGGRCTEILEYGDGTMIELGDGHIDEQKEQSRMCLECTYDRVKILQCSHNSLVPLPASLSTHDAAQRDAAFANLKQAADVLLDPLTGKTGSSFPLSSHKWCSLCQEPASFSCQTLQPVDVYAAIVDCDEETYGCGFMLCKNCHDLTNHFKGNLHAVVAFRRDRLAPLRADVDYLLPKAEHNTIYNFYMED